MDYAGILTNTPQTKPIPGKNQVENSAGGYVFQVDPWTALRRFLVIGTAGGTYYADEKDLTLKNADILVKLIKLDGPRFVADVVKISVEGLAHKNDPAIFALALAATHGDEATKKAAYGAIALGCRTGTHIFHFTDAVNKLRKWSRGLRTGVSKWYTEKAGGELEYQLVKYRQRDGWTHRDVMRLAHPKFATAGQQELAKWAVGKPAEVGEFPRVAAFEALQKPGVDKAEVARLVKDAKLPWEAVPTQFLNDKDVLDALFEQMPMHALVRNLNRLTRAGLVAPFSAREKDAAARITDAEAIKKSRMHPIALLLALRTYAKGRPATGTGESWNPSQKICDALEAAFYLSFGNVKPAGVPSIVALDVAGSMSSSAAGTVLTAREASTAMAMVTVRTEPDVLVVAFAAPNNGRGYDPGRKGFTEMPIGKNTSLREALALSEQASRTFCATDCSLPFRFAKARGIKGVGNFAVWTDSETYVGDVHPHQALEQYRQFSGTASRSVVAATTSTGFTIADPSDPLMLDVAGFSADVPSVIAAFARGEA